MARLAVLLHGRETDVPLYEAALRGKARNFVWGEGAPAYSEVAGLAHDYPTLRGFLAAQVPEWHPWTRLVLVAFSSGGWAARAWLRNEADRKLVDAVLLLDCLYPDVSGGGCAASIVEGPVAYARLVSGSPGTRTLVVTSSGYTEPCVGLLARSAPASPAVHIFAPGGTHRSHMEVAGPSAVAEWVRPKLGVLPLGTRLPVAAGAAAGASGALAALWLTGRLSV